MTNARILSAPIEKLVFSDPRLKTRVLNALRLRNINTIGQVVERTEQEMLDMRQFGPACLAQLVAALRGVGLELRHQDNGI